MTVLPGSSWTTRRRWPTTRQRACAAVAVAALAGWSALSIANRSMASSHYLCDFVVGGEAGDGVWLCPDGTAYAWPLLLVGGGAAGAVLIAYALLEVRRAGAATLHDLADVAVQLGAAVLLGTSLLVAGVWLTALAPPQGAVAAMLLPVAAASLVGRRRDGRARAVLVACTAAAVFFGLLLMLVLPLTTAAALCWLAALALRALARRRERRA